MTHISSSYSAWHSPHKRHPPSPNCKQGPLCLSSDPFCLLKAETGPVALLLASQAPYGLQALFSPPAPSQPARLNSRQHSFGFIPQLWPESRPELAGSVEDQHRPIQLTHNLLVILLGTSDSDVTLLQPGSWWDRVRR